MADIDPKTLQNSLNDLNLVISATTDMLVESGRKFLDIMDRIVEKGGRVATDAKAAASWFEASRMDFREILKTVHDMNRSDFFNGKTLGNVKKQLEEMRAVAMRMSKDPDYGKGNQIAAIKSLDAIDKLLGKIKEKAGDAKENLKNAFDSSMVDEFSTTMKGAALSIEAVNEKAKKMHGLIFQTLSSVRVLAPLMKVVERHPATVEARGQFTRKVADQGDVVKRFLGGVPMDATGRPDTKVMDAKSKEELKKLAEEIRGMDEKQLGRMAGQISGRKGPLGWLDRQQTTKILRRAAVDVGTEGEIGAGAAAGMGRIVSGGGSWTEGLMAESGGAALAGLGTILYALKKSFDMMVASNQDIFDKIGTSGGLFAAGRGQPGQAFQNVRMNLTPGMNMYGQTYEKNLQIAETINKFGVSVGDLAEAGSDLSRNVIGLAGGKAGQGIAATVYGGARLAGLDERAATEQIMKLLMQYHQSLESTDAFFNKLNEDTKASGMTSTKYIQIIDDITGQFDHMARGIEDVTSALRMLGHTGIMTSEQVSDAMKAMMMTKTTPELGAYLALHMPPEVLQATAATQKQNVGEQAQEAYDNLVDAFKSAGMSQEEAEKRLAGQGVSASALAAPGGNAVQKANILAGQVLTGVGDAARKQAVGSSLENLQTSRQALTATQNLLLNPHSPAAALEFSHQPFQGPAMQAALNMTKIPEILMRAQVGGNKQDVWKTLMLHPETLAQRNMEINKVSEALQFNPEDIYRQRTFVLAGAGAQIQEAMKGGLPDAQYEKIAGYLGLQPGAGKQDVVKALSDSTENQAKAAEGLAGDFDTFMQMFTAGSPLAKGYADAAKAAGAQQTTQMAKDLGAALTGTDVYLKQIRDILFNQFLGLVTDIADVAMHPSHLLTGTPGQRVEAEKATGLAAAADVAQEARYKGPGSVWADLEKAKVIQQNMRADIDRTQADLTTAKAAAAAAPDDQEKKGAVQQKETELRNLQAKLKSEVAVTDNAQKALQDYQTGKLATRDERVNTLGDIKALHTIMGLDAYNKFYGIAVPPALQPGEAATGTGAEAAKAKEEKTPSISVQTFQYNTTQGTVQASTGDPNSILDGKETSVQSATQAGSAILDKAKKSTKKTTTSLADF